MSKMFKEMESAIKRKSSSANELYEPQGNKKADKKAPEPSHKGISSEAMKRRLAKQQQGVDE